MQKGILRKELMYKKVLYPEQAKSKKHFISLSIKNVSEYSRRRSCFIQLVISIIITFSFGFLFLR
jgi:hypothetical protein